MNKREIVRQYLITTVIYDSDLSTKVVLALSNDMPEVSPDRCYDVEIVFDRHVYSNGDFYRFPLSKEVLRPKGHEPKTKEEKMKQRIYDILSEQLDRITEALENLEVKFMSTALIGDDCAPDSVKITIYCQEEAENQEAKKNTQVYKTNRIIPDLPALLAHYVKIMSEHSFEEYARGEDEEIP